MKLCNTITNKLKIFRMILLLALFNLVTLIGTVAWAENSDTGKLTKKLFKAISNNDLASVRIVVAQGANILAINQEGLTPAGLAVENGFFDIAHYIVGVRNQKNLEKINKITAPTRTSASNITETMKSEKNRKTTIPLQPKPMQNYKRLQSKVKQTPEDNNPFSPKPKLTPIQIVGEVKIPALKPLIPNNLIKSDFEPYGSRENPLKISTSTPSPNARTPSQINPLSKQQSKTRSNDGMVNKMLDRITNVFAPKNK